LVVIEESPNDDALSPQGEQAIDEELSPGALLDTDGDGFEKKNKKEKKHKKEKKEKKRKKSDIVEAEEHGREMPSPDEPRTELTLATVKWAKQIPSWTKPVAWLQRTLRKLLFEVGTNSAIVITHQTPDPTVTMRQRPNQTGCGR
jgi:hypothetical protein